MALGVWTWDQGGGLSMAEPNFKQGPVSGGVYGTFSRDDRGGSSNYWVGQFRMPGNNCYITGRILVQGDRGSGVVSDLGKGTCSEEVLKLMNVQLGGIFTIGGPKPPAGTPVDLSTVDPKVGDTTQVGNNGTCSNGKPPVKDANTGELSCNEAEDDDCPVPKNQEMRWLTCPIFSAMGLLTNTIDSAINEYLTTGNKIYGSSAEDGYKQAWQTFRNFGIALVIIAGLVMLVSEAFGLEFIDAYTVRKVLPRLLVAVVGISLSWELCKFLITFFDTLGRAAGSIIYTSFSIGDEGISIWSLITANILAVGGGVAKVVFTGQLLGGMGLISLIGTLVLALLVAAFVLIVRQVLIIACVIFAPLAIAAYVLPNTNKLSHFWWDLFIKMLMLYPVATGMIALCKALGRISMQSAAADPSAIGQLLGTVSGIIIFVAGYGLLLAVPRFVGGAFANISGMINDKSKGGFDRLKNYRDERKQQRKEAWGRGELYKNAPEKSLRARMNRAGEGAATFAGSSNKMGMLRSKQAREEAMTQRRNVLDAQFMKTDQFGGIQHDDDVLRAMASGRSEEESRANMKRIYGMEGEAADRAIAGAKNAGGFSAVKQQAATKQLAAIGTGYENLEQMAQATAVASRGNVGSINGMIGDMRASSKKAGRFDLGGAGQRQLATLAEDTHKAGGVAPAQAVHAAKLEAGMSTDNSSLVRGKPGSTGEIVSALTTELKTQNRTINDPKSTSTQREAARQSAGKIAAKLQNIQQSAMYGPEKAVEKMDGAGMFDDDIRRAVESISHASAQHVPARTEKGDIIREADGSLMRVRRDESRPGADSFDKYVTRNPNTNQNDIRIRGGDE